MGALRTIFYKRALLFIRKTAKWYIENMGEKASQHFLNGINDTIETLSNMPTIGVVDEKNSTAKIKIYSFLAHPKYRVVYRYTSRTLYIIAIRATKMTHEN